LDRISQGAKHWKEKNTHKPAKLSSFSWKHWKHRQFFVGGIYENNGAAYANADEKVL